MQPLVTRENANEEYIVWPTDRGYLNVGYINRRAEDTLALRYRVETGAAIAGRPAYLPPDPKVPGDSGLIIAVSRDGYVHAIQEKNGALLWRFSTGEPVVAVAGGHRQPRLRQHATGRNVLPGDQERQKLWFAPNVVQFVAASKRRVYAADNIGRLLVLNAENGSALDAIATESIPISIAQRRNRSDLSGRHTGLIQCLHEVEQSEPIVHDKDRKQAAEAEEQPAAEPKKEVPEKEKPAKKEQARQEGAGHAQGTAGPEGDGPPKEAKERVKRAISKSRPAPPEPTRISSTSRLAPRPGQEGQGRGQSVLSRGP